MLTNLFPDETKLMILNNSKDINNGAVFENYVAQELASHMFRTFYYNSKSQGEIDFMIEYKGEVLPIEVKSGKDYKKHSALNNILDNENYNISQAFILSKANMSVEDKKVYMPIYMTMYIKKTMIDMVIKPNLEWLNSADNE